MTEKVVLAIVQLLFKATNKEISEEDLHQGLRTVTEGVQADGSSGESVSAIFS